MDDSSVINQDS